MEPIETGFAINNNIVAMFKEEISLLCEKGNKGFMVCVEHGCNKHPVLCKDDSCDCFAPHGKHSQIRVRGFMERLSQPTVSKDIQELERKMTTTIESLINRVSDLGKKHQQHLEQYRQQEFSSSGLRSKLLRKESLEAEQMTGDAFARLLEDIETERPASSPYRISLERLDEKSKKLESELKTILDQIEQLWVFEFPISVKTYQGKSTLYYYELSNTVEELKLKIQSQEGFPLEQIKLTCRGTEMDNKKTLKEYDIKQEEGLYLGLRFRGVLNVFINGLQGKTFTLKLESRDTIDKMKAKIQQREGVPTPQQVLTFAGVRLEDGRTLSDYHVRNECTIELAVTEMKLI